VHTFLCCVRGFKQASKFHLKPAGPYRTPFFMCLMDKFQQQADVLEVEITNTNASTLLWQTHSIPAHQALCA
jgi:hypothetical protein